MRQEARGAEPQAGVPAPAPPQPPCPHHHGPGEQTGLGSGRDAPSPAPRPAVPPVTPRRCFPVAGTARPRSPGRSVPGGRAGPRRPPAPRAEEMPARRAVPRAHSPRRTAGAPWDGPAAPGASRRPRAGQEGAGAGRDRGGKREPRAGPSCLPGNVRGFCPQKATEESCNFIRIQGHSSGAQACGVFPLRVSEGAVPCIPIPGRVLPIG